MGDGGGVGKLATCAIPAAAKVSQRRREGGTSVNSKSPCLACRRSSEARNIPTACSLAVLVVRECVTRRKLQTPGNAEEHKKKKQETPTINPIGPTDKPHRPRTKHYRKDSLGDE